MKGAPFLLAAVLCAARGAWAALGADPALVVVSPEEYLGKRVTLDVKFTKIENGRDPWEDQANLETGRVIKFTVAPLGDMRCYAARTPANKEALTDVKKGRRLLLTGSLKRFRADVKIVREVKNKRKGASRTVVQTVRGRIRYGFMVEKIEDASRSGD